MRSVLAYTSCFEPYWAFFGFFFTVRDDISKPSRFWEGRSCLCFIRYIHGLMGQKQIFISSQPFPTLKSKYDHHCFISISGELSGIVSSRLWSHSHLKNYCACGTCFNECSRLSLIFSLNFVETFLVFPVSAVMGSKMKYVDSRASSPWEFIVWISDVKALKLFSGWKSLRVVVWNRIRFW